MVFGVTNDAQLCLLDKDSVFKRKEMLHVVSVLVFMSLLGLALFEML